jgi:hypothetical protein
MKTDILGDPQFELGDIALTKGAAEMAHNGLLVDLYHGDRDGGMASQLRHYISMDAQPSVAEVSPSGVLDR